MKMLQKKLPILQFNKAGIYRFNHCVIDDLDWTIYEGEHWIITGNNGVGKTSILEAIRGRLALRSGSLSFPKLTSEIGSQSLYDVKKNKISYISFEERHRSFQNKERYYQQRFHAFDFDDITVEDYLAELGYDQTQQSHQDVIIQCGISQYMSMSRVKLSHGQSRKLRIAAGLLKSPQILIIDNPYIGLDKNNRNIFNALLDKIGSQENITIILCGQFESLPNCITHRIHIASNKIEHLKISSGQEKLHDQTTTIDKNSLSMLKQYYHDFTWSTNYEHAIRIKGVEISYPGTKILEKINWTIRQGEQWALVGSNGSGKSTLFGLIAADHPQAYKNNVEIFDQKRGHLNNIWDVKSKIGFSSPELHAYFHDPELTNIRIIKEGLFPTIYDRKPLTEIQELAISSIFRYFEISHLQTKRFIHCSTGEQKLILFVRAIMKNPPMLLLDEPFQTFDAQTMYRAKHLLEHILSTNHTLLFITHYKSEIPKTVTQFYNLSHDGMQTEHYDL